MNTSERLIKVLHEDLVKLAAKWLTRQRCSVVITEMCGGAAETPDAIGWRGSHSILIECKTSHSDFKADQNKTARRITTHGVGECRYYLTFQGVILSDMLPPKWGLLWVTDRGSVKMIQQAESFEDVNHRYEKAMLLSCLRRIGQNAPAGVSIRCYTIETQKRATLHVEKEE